MPIIGLIIHTVNVMPTAIFDSLNQSFTTFCREAEPLVK